MNGPSTTTPGMAQRARAKPVAAGKAGPGVDHGDGPRRPRRRTLRRSFSALMLLLCASVAACHFDHVAQTRNPQRRAEATDEVASSPARVRQPPYDETVITPMESVGAWFSAESDMVSAAASPAASAEAARASNQASRLAASQATP